MAHHVLHVFIGIQSVGFAPYGLILRGEGTFLDQAVASSLFIRRKESGNCHSECTVYSSLSRLYRTLGSLDWNISSVS